MEANRIRGGLRLVNKKFTRRRCLLLYILILDFVVSKLMLKRQLTIWAPNGGVWHTLLLVLQTYTRYSCRVGSNPTGAPCHSIWGDTHTRLHESVNKTLVIDPRRELTSIHTNTTLHSTLCNLYQCWCAVLRLEIVGYLRSHTVQISEVSSNREPRSTII